MNKWFGRSGPPTNLSELSVRQLRARAAAILARGKGRDGLDDVRDILEHIEARYDQPSKTRMRVIDGKSSG